MATQQLVWKSGDDEITVSQEGVVVAVIRYALNKIYQVELSLKISRALEYEILCQVYLLSNADAGAEVLPLSAVFELPPHEVRNELRRRNITTVRVAYERITEALAAVLSRVSVKYLSVKTIPYAFNYRDEVNLFFELHSKREFTLWRSEWVPNPELENLHIVPAYHPCMQGKRPIHMINGDTDYRTHGYSIVRVESPVEARAEIDQKSSPCTWTHMKHPFFAKGTAIELTVRSGLLRSRDGVRELARFLLATLGKSDEYVEVSGGFRAPLYHAHNLLIKKNLPSPRRKPFTEHTRGCEEFNVWAYRTLLAEGVLADAYVPEWFLAEGWLDIYEGSEEKPGLF